VIPSASIALPTNGGVIVSALLATAKDPGNRNGEFCKVLGSIRPVGPRASDIHFEVNLPTNPRITLWVSKLGPAPRNLQPDSPEVFTANDIEGLSIRIAKCKIRKPWLATTPVGVDEWLGSLDIWSSDRADMFTLR
jgi:hypothetical protein